MSFEKLEKTIPDMLQEFMKPYLQPIIQSNLRVSLKVLNDLPETINCDWKLYQEILFHIIQNAVKFSNPGSEIVISVLYCPLEKVNEPNPAYTHRTVSSNVKSSLNSFTSYSSTSLASREMDNIGYLLTVVQD